MGGNGTQAVPYKIAAKMEFCQTQNSIFLISIVPKGHHQIADNSY